MEDEQYDKYDKPVMAGITIVGLGCIIISVGLLFVYVGYSANKIVLIVAALIGTIGVVALFTTAFVWFFMEIEEVKNPKPEKCSKQIERLETRIELLEFERDCPEGVRVVSNKLEYVKDKRVQHFQLPKCISFENGDGYRLNRWTVKKGVLMLQTCDKKFGEKEKVIGEEEYEFDYNKEELIKIKRIIKDR